MGLLLCRAGSGRCCECSNDLPEIFTENLCLAIIIIAEHLRARLINRAVLSCIVFVYIFYCHAFEESTVYNVIS